MRGELLLKQRQPGEAIDCFKRAIELEPKRSSTYLKLSRALALTGRPDEAEEAVKESRRLDPFDHVLMKAAEFMQKGEPDKAEKIYRQVLMKDPNNVDALRLLAEIATTHNQYRDAEVFLKRAVDCAPDFARAWADLVITQIELEKGEEAVESAKRLIKLDPERPDSLLLLGNAYASLSRQEDALEAYEKVLAVVPSHAGALSGMGHMLKTIGRQEEAIDTYRRCLRENPRFVEPYWSLANFKTFTFDIQ